MTPFGDARTRILLYFVAGIALPSGLLGYLAFRGIQNDRALVERERRNELQRVVAQVQLNVEARLKAVVDNVSGAVASWDSLPSAPADGPGRLLRDVPLIEALFTVDSARGVRVVAGRGLRFRTEPPSQPAPESESASTFRAAREREIRSGDLNGALVLYRSALAQARDNRDHGSALNAVARVQRKLGDLAGSGRSYERLGAQFADVQLSGGMPLGAAAGLEYAALLLEARDSTGAARVLLDNYADVLKGRWVLTPAQFDFVTINARELLERLVRTTGLVSLRDSLTMLTEAERTPRERALAWLAFEEEAQRLFNGNRAGGRRAVTVRGSTFHTVLLDRPQAWAGSIRWGFTLSAQALATDALSDVLKESAGRVTWVLLTQDGDTLVASSAPPAPGAPTVTAGIGDFSPWSFGLSTPAAATGGTFLASRRAVYLYAFVLLAGILLFGLILTIRSVGRELELARMQSDFVSTVSHEFKSPLTAIRQMAEMLRADRVVSEERRRRYYDVLLEQSERLSMLVDNVLDFARMEERRRRMALEPVDIGSLMQETVAEAQHRVAHEGFTIRLELSGPLPVVRLDADAIRQALGNLIDNGVKYSGSSRELVVSGFRDDGFVVIAVQDFGIGIDAGETGKVFERFYRGGHELTRTVKGTGLGLTLVKQIVDAHAGVVDVRSEPGRGSTFSMRLPATLVDQTSTEQAIA